MLEFARTADAVAATSSKLEKARILAAYLDQLDPPDLRLAATWMTGRPFRPNDPRPPPLGRRTTWNQVGPPPGRHTPRTTPTSPPSPTPPPAPVRRSPGSSG